jgi:hypothetical protein
MCFYLYSIKNGALRAPATAKAQCHLFNNDYFFCLHGLIYTTNFNKNQVFEKFFICELTNGIFGIIMSKKAQENVHTKRQNQRINRIFG